jgi:prophage regulatory protein
MQRRSSCAVSAPVQDLFEGGVVNHRLLEVIPVPVPERIIRLKTVLDRTGLSRSTIYRKMGEGTFPPRLKIGVHGAGWHESAIDRWVANPAAYRPDNDNDAAHGDA